MEILSLCSVGLVYDRCHRLYLFNVWFFSASHTHTHTHFSFRKTSSSYFWCPYQMWLFWGKTLSQVSSLILIQSLTSLTINILIHSMNINYLYCELAFTVCLMMSKNVCIYIHHMFHLRDPLASSWQFSASNPLDQLCRHRLSLFWDQIIFWMETLSPIMYHGPCKFSPCYQCGIVSASHPNLGLYVCVCVLTESAVEELRSLLLLLLGCAVQVIAHLPLTAWSLIN